MWYGHLPEKGRTILRRRGKRRDHYFTTLPEARNWLADAKYADRHANIFIPSDVTVDAWFHYWIENIVGDLAPNTRRNYSERYKHNIQPIIGNMCMTDVKPIHYNMINNKIKKIGINAEKCYLYLFFYLRFLVRFYIMQSFIFFYFFFYFFYFFFI